jgi:hypothetical protein
MRRTDARSKWKETRHADARLREVEPGVFSAEYPGEMNSDDAGPETFPDAHIGTDATGIKN